MLPIAFVLLVTAVKDAFEARGEKKTRGKRRD